MNALGALLTTPLAWVSFGFHEGARAVLMLKLKLARLAVALRSRLGRGAPNASSVQPRWRLYSEQCEQPSQLPRLSILAPRWNCHAMLASFGPFEVKDRVTCRVDELEAQSESWTIVVYDLQLNTIAFCGSWGADSVEREAGHVTFALSAGRYVLSVRCYSEADRLALPDVHVDSERVYPGRVVEGEASRYARVLEGIRGKDGLLYRALHYYVFHSLAASRGAPSKWLRRQFLPVGNPETEWHFGHLERGRQLRITVDPSDVERVITFVCFYNWASFPVHWARAREGTWVSPAFDLPVAYAVRRVVKHTVSRRRELAGVNRGCRIEVAPNRLTVAG